MEVCGELLDKVYHHIIGDTAPPPIGVRKKIEPVSSDQKIHSKPIPSSAPEILGPIKEGSLGRPKSFSCINELKPSKRNVIDGSEKILEEQKDDEKEESSQESSLDQR